MNTEIVEAARGRLANAMGQKLATKATPAFCLAFGQPGPPSIAEVVLARPSASVILEFDPQPQVADAIDAAVESLRNSKSLIAFRNALKKVELPSVTSGLVTEVMESGRSEPELLPLRAGRLLRQLKVMTSRDNFYKVTGPITDSIEQHAQSFIHPDTITPRSSRAPITEV